jgi:Na+/melibiose symporter-like transporter
MPDATISAEKYSAVVTILVGGVLVGKCLGSTQYCQVSNRQPDSAVSCILYLLCSMVPSWQLWSALLVMKHVGSSRSRHERQQQQHQR